jgi:hypothetical protein
MEAPVIAEKKNDQLVGVSRGPLEVTVNEVVVLPNVTIPLTT